MDMSKSPVYYTCVQMFADYLTHLSSGHIEEYQVK